MKFPKKIYLIASILILAFSLNVYANPQGASVVAGSATFNSSTPNTLTINTASNKTIINYNSFSIAAKETTIINQPSAGSSVLNRVVGVSPSSIYGTLSSNGQIFLVNPNGIIFGQGSQVNAPAILASTLNITNNNFLNGNYTFFKERHKGSSYIINQGRLAASPGGYIALLSQAVNNQGVIIANLGTVALAAGNKMTLALDSQAQISVVVDDVVQSKVFGPSGQSMNSAVSNSGIIKANGGMVLLTAKVLNDVFDYAVNNSGVVQASSMQENNGVVEFTASGAPVINTGKIKATQGGSIILQSINGSTILGPGSLIDASGDIGGLVEILGDQVELIDAQINDSGINGGGTVLIGGNFHGAGPQENASAVTIDANSSINADAINSGNGGSIAVWSNGNTSVAGILTAQGGANLGNGGYIETSGKQVLLTDSTKVNTLAPHGKIGLWLLDPTNWIIAGTEGNETPAQVETYLASTGYSIEATNDITVSDPITWSTAQTLTLSAGNNVLISATMTASTAGSGIVLIAGNDVTATATITASANGSVIKMTAGHDVSVTVVTASDGGSVNLSANNDVIVNGAITADTGSNPVTLLAGNDGTGVGTVQFVGGGQVSSTLTTIRFNPVNYGTTSAEIAAYGPKVVKGALDAKAWVFVQANNKPYDGNTKATLSFKDPTVSSTLAVTLASGSATFDTENAGDGKTVSYTGYDSIIGANAGLLALFTKGVTTANITPAPLTVTANAQTKVYGTTDPALTYTYIGLVNSDTSTDFTGALTRTTGENVATGPYAITQGTLSTAADSNYAITIYVGANLVITPAPLTVTANSGQTKVYGALDPTFTYTHGTLALSDTGSVFSGTLARDTSENVADAHAITIGSLSAGSNYNINFTSANFAITPATLTVTADHQSKTYGGTDPTLTYTPSGTLYYGDAYSVITGVSLSTDTLAAATAGNHVITATGGIANNYNVIDVNGTLTVATAPLTITASNQSKTYGTALSLGTSAFTITSGTLYNGDTATGVTLTSSGAAATANVSGSPYSITPSAAIGTGLGNYTISYAEGLLTVNPVVLTVNASQIYNHLILSIDYSTMLYNGTVVPQFLIVAATGPNKTYGTALTSGSSVTNFTYSGETAGETVTGVTLTPDAAGLLATTAAGKAYVVTPSLAIVKGRSNYVIYYAPYDGTVI
jgi:filamentous hemagglutinin family protein